MFIKPLEYFGTGRCCIVFGENRNLLNIQIGRSKFANFKAKYIFVITMTVYIKKGYKFCVYTRMFTPDLKIYFRFKLKRQYI